MLEIQKLACTLHPTPSMRGFRDIDPSAAICAVLANPEAHIRWKDSRSSRVGALIKATPARCVRCIAALWC